MAVRITLLTLLAMCAFAANSVLGRIGLVEGGIGAGSFALVRLISGALVLALLAGPRQTLQAGTWTGAAALFVYAGCFSYAYIALPAGTGALILFATVQIIMVGAGLRAGETLSLWQWGGMGVAICALVWLLSPGLDAPPLLGAGLMILAGLGWGSYSLIGWNTGGRAHTPTLRTAGNFLKASLIAGLCLPGLIYLRAEPMAQASGLLYAVASGALTSGLGYAIWYAALPHLSATKAGIAQLSVPALAAIGGVLFLSEPLTLRFLVASTLILTGTAIATVIAPADKSN